jgi:hypothetical protein
MTENRIFTLCRMITWVFIVFTAGSNQTSRLDIKIDKYTGKLLIKFQNILRTNTQVIIRHRVKILFSVISSPITLEWQKWKSYPPQRSCRGVYWFHHVRPSVCRQILCRTITWVVFLRIFDLTNRI